MTREQKRIKYLAENLRKANKEIERLSSALLTSERRLREGSWFALTDRQRAAIRMSFDVMEAMGVDPDMLLPREDDALIVDFERPEVVGIQGARV